jgi:hypothetical protein
MRQIFFTITLLICINSSAAAQTCNWQGIDSNWNNPANWSCGHVPGVADTVVIGGGLVHYPRLDGNIAVNDTASVNFYAIGSVLYKCRKLTVLTGASLRFTSGQLLCAGSCSFNGTMWGGGITAYGGGATIDGSTGVANLSVSGAALYQGAGLTVRYFFVFFPSVGVFNSYIEGKSGVIGADNNSPPFGSITGSTFAGAMNMYGTMSGSGNLVRLRERDGGAFLTFPQCLGNCSSGSGPMRFNIQNDSPADDTVAVQLWYDAFLQGNVVFNTNNDCGIMRFKKSVYDYAYGGGFTPGSANAIADTILIQGNVTIANKGNIIFNNPYKITGTITLNGGHIIKAWKGAVNTFPPGDTLRCPINFGLGLLNLAGGKLFTETTISNDSIINASASNYIVTLPPNGKLKRSVANFPRLFPVGTATSYNPATLTNSGTGDAFSVQVQQGVYANGSSGALFTNKVVDRTWYIDEQTPGGSNVELTVQWNAADELPAFVPSNCNLAHYNGSYWEGGVSGAALGSDPFTFSRSGLTSFSPFSVGRQGVLASDCQNFTGAATANGIVLRWLLVPDGQQYQYILQRSNDGVNFTDITKIDAGAGGNSFTDKTYSNGANYYRIIQVAANAAAQQLCRIIEVTGKRNQSVVNLVGNPVGNNLLLSISSLLNQQLSIEIIGVDGRKAGNWIQNVPKGNSSLKLPVDKLSPGIYLIKVVGQDVQSVIRFIKE